MYGLMKESINIYDSQLSSYTYLSMYESKETNTYPYILYFGNILSYKGLEYLFEAMEKVHSVLPNLKLIAAGKGKYYFDIEKYQSSDYIDIKNYFIPDEYLANLIRNCLFVVIPYVDATQSGVVMSAYAFNKPCIATNVGGLPEMVKHETYGLIVEAKNSIELANAILKLANSQKKLSEYSANIERDYGIGDKSWDCISVGLKSIYERIIN